MGGIYCKNASSTLSSQGKNNYGVNNLNDSDPRMAIHFDNTLCSLCI